MICFISVHLSVFLLSSCLLYFVLTERSSPLFPCGTFSVVHYCTCSFYVNGLIDLFFFSSLSPYLVLNWSFHLGQKHIFFFKFFSFFFNFWRKRLKYTDLFQNCLKFLWIESWELRKFHKVFDAIQT